MSDLVVPDAIQPVVGWRAWLVCETNEGLRLGSIVYKAIWPAREPLRAHCRRAAKADVPSHEPPAPFGECGTVGFECGIHAAKSAKKMRAYLSEEWGEPNRRIVWRGFGRVYLWGRIQVHELGWRAEYAYPKSLSLLSATAGPSATEYRIAGIDPPTRRARDEIAAELRAAYGIPVFIPEPEPPSLTERLRAVLRRAA